MAQSLEMVDLRFLTGLEEVSANSRAEYACKQDRCGYLTLLINI